MGGRTLDPGVYIRSVANRAHAGGLSRTAARLVTALDAAGYGTILLETVGAGQSEVEVAALADTVLVVLAPGFGDEIQALKAGILETADLFVVNKADLPGADRVAATLAPSPRPILLVSAATGAGIPELVAALQERGAARGGEGSGAGTPGSGPSATSQSAAWRARRRESARQLLEEAARSVLWQRFARTHDTALAAMTERVIAGELDPEGAAHLLLDTSDQ
jgi:LAO/AO transport system kinase